jgi:HTH-type transcriptional regulator/antitoxin HipB
MSKEQPSAEKKEPNDNSDLYFRINSIGEAIKRTRKEQQLTQEQLGKLIGVQKSQISKLENNNRNVTLDTIQKVFNALKTNIHFILNPNEKG